MINNQIIVKEIFNNFLQTLVSSIWGGMLCIIVGIIIFYWAVQNSKKYTESFYTSSNKIRLFGISFMILFMGVAIIYELVFQDNYIFILEASNSHLPPSSLKINREDEIKGNLEYVKFDTNKYLLYYKLRSRKDFFEDDTFVLSNDKNYIKTIVLKNISNDTLYFSPAPH